MRRTLEQLTQCLRYLAVMAVIALGILTILASGTDREETEEATITLSASGISSNEIALSWTLPVFSPEDVYEVYMDGAFLLVTETLSAVTSDLMPETEYCFQIQVDTDAPFGGWREHSNVACATTLPAP